MYNRVQSYSDDNISNLVNALNIQRYNESKSIPLLLLITNPK